MVTSFRLDSSPGPKGPGLRSQEGTTARWNADVTISGKLAAFGPQRLLDRIARKNVDAFVDGIRAGLLAQARA